MELLLAGKIILLLLLVVFSIWITILPANIASGKGHSWFLWFVLTLVCWPIAMVGALCIAPNANANRYRGRFLPRTAPRFKCPYCSESIPVGAQHCRFCNAPIEIR
jgi:hypothetical protein